MIKVTFEFATVELAIATLGKIMVGAPVARTEGSDPAAGRVVKEPAAPTTRKPRADAGKPRGSYKNAGVPADADPKGHGSTPTPAAPAPETAASPAPAEGDKPQPSGVTPAVAAATEADAQKALEADAQKALEALFAAKGLAEAQRVLGLFGVAALRFLPADKRGEFITKAQEATNG